MKDLSNLRAALSHLRAENRRWVLGLIGSSLLVAVLLPIAIAPEPSLALLAVALGGLFLVAQPHWGVLANFFLGMLDINPTVIGPFGAAQLIILALLVPLGLQLFRDRRLWVWHAPQVPLLLGIGGMLLTATVWSLLFHPAPPFGVEGGSLKVMIPFVLQIVFLIQFVYFIRAPRHVFYSVAVLLLVIIVAAVDGARLLEGGRTTGRADASVGWAANANRLAFLCVWGTALFWSLRYKGPTGWWRPFTLVPLLGLPIATLMTGSRNGLIQIVLLGALILREQWQRSHAQRTNVLVLMLAVALLVLTVAPSAMLQRASSFDLGGGPTTSDRLLTLRAGAAMMAESPLLGIGPGNFHWRNESLTGRAMSSHNSYLWALTAGGPLLLLLYLILFRQTHRMLRLVEQWGSSAFVWLATAFRFNLIILLTFSFFADMWLTSIVAFLIAFTIVLLRVGVTNAEAGAQLRSPHFV